MQYVDHPFYIELMPESPDELRVAKKAFGVTEDCRTVMVRATADYERARIVKIFQDAWRGK
jgi:hypothetical protein